MEDNFKMGFPTKMDNEMSIFNKALKQLQFFKQSLQFTRMSVGVSTKEKFCNHIKVSALNDWLLKG